MLSVDELFLVVQAMDRYGGSFYKALSIALRRADPRNRERILTAFPEILERYGPNTQFYKQTDNNND